MSAAAAFERLWYGSRARAWPLLVLALPYAFVIAVRRALYAIGLFRRRHVAAPVVVVGNLTVGGTGKTPVAAWLARELSLRGRRVGVVLRGYGGRWDGPPRVVEATDDPAVVGDEALLHARRSPHVVVIGADRAGAAGIAVGRGAEVVVCDDGLQHLALARDLEIVVVDGGRGFGTGWLLPAGPLREPASRLERADVLVVTRRGGSVDRAPRARGPYSIEARLVPGAAVNLRTGERRELAAFGGRPLHALAAIGHPEQFFAALSAAGLRFEPHRLPDHAALDPQALPFPADATVLMTEKDAVKCASYARAGWWYVELDVEVGRDDARDLVARVLERTGLTGAGVKLG
ncbi:MAG: tetraacyldisaccharide 4'-kinase [Steroidobacteraceae bacterium]